MSLKQIKASFNLTTALVISVCVVDSVTIAYDGSLMGSLNVMPSYRNYFQLTTATQAVNTCATFLGAIAVGPWTGWFINKYGRKPGIYVSSFVNILGAVLAGAAQNSGMFIAGRFIIGIAVGFAQTAAGTYVGETTAPGIRALSLGLYFSCWAVGALIAAGVSYGCSSMDQSTWAWRIPSLLQGAAPAMALAVLPFLPESPRWLAFNDRQDEALEVLARINGRGQDDAEVQLQYREIIDTMAFEKVNGESLSFKTVVSTEANRKRLFLALSIAPLAMLTGSNIITYYFGSMLTQAGVTDPTTQLEINVILSAWQLCVAVTGSFLADKIGRRMLALGSLGACSVFFYMLAGLTAKYGTSGDKSGTYGTIACIFLFLGSYSFGITPLTAMYAPEVLSYNMRANGIALQGILIKTCGVFVTFVFPFMMQSVGWKSYIINASWNILIWLYIFFQWVETKGKTLEEIDEIFDGVKHSEVPDLRVLQTAKEDGSEEQQVEIVAQVVKDRS